MSSKGNDKDSKKENIDNESENMKDLNFFQKMKKNKKYRAKMELLGYGIFFVILILFLNFSQSTSKNYNYSNEVKDNDSVNEVTTNLYQDIKDNFLATITVTTVKDGNSSIRNYEIINNGDNFAKIFKIDNGAKIEYKVLDTGEFYNLSNVEVEEKEIFDLIRYRYLNIDNIKKYISKGTVDYTTKYSSGVELSSYKVLLKDILLDNQTDEFITINTINEENKVTIDIDYTDLLKNDSIDSCNVKAIYTNIVNEGEIG